MTKLTGQQVSDAGLEGWTYLACVLGGLVTRIRTRDFAHGLEVVGAIGAAAESADHHPDVDLRYDHVDVRLVSHDEGGVTERDVALARAITSVATGSDARLEPTAVSRVELALDSPHGAAVSPFWQAVLAVDAVDDDLVDAHGSLPAVWFQPSGDEEPRQRWHLDVWVDPAEVQPRIEAAVAAGGRVVNDAEAPAFWALADPEGNQVCLCTWQSR